MIKAACTGSVTTAFCHLSNSSEREAMRPASLAGLVAFDGCGHKWLEASEPPSVGVLDTKCLRSAQATHPGTRAALETVRCSQMSGRGASASSNGSAQGHWVLPRQRSITAARKHASVPRSHASMLGMVNSATYAQAARPNSRT